MPTKPTRGPDPAKLSVAKVSRKPQQGRSKASLERILTAARELMLERGNEDFTLQDVSDRGKVSIGSIYLRFVSKDNLVRTVILNALDDITHEETVMLDRLVKKCHSLTEFVPRYVEGYAEVLKFNAPLLRLGMERAAFDPMIAVPGRAHGMRAACDGIDAMLTFRDGIGGDDADMKVLSCYHIIFATLARELSLGSKAEAVHDYDWEQLKRELGRMCLAYLQVT